MTIVTVLSHWSFDTAIIGASLLVVLLYALGWHRLGWDKGLRLGGNQLYDHSLSGDRGRYWAGEWWRPLALAGAIFSMIIAGCSPIDYYSGYLFWVHMIQHLILIAVVSPLVVLAAPWMPIWNALSPGLRGLVVGVTERFRGRTRGIRSVVTHPLFCLAAFIAGTWVWHSSFLYDVALQNDILHDYGEHNIFILVGIIFWLQLIPSAPFVPVLNYVMRVGYLLLAILQNVALSIYLAFTPHPLYAPYAALAHRPGGISALTDQKIGAAIMWAVGDLPFVIAIFVMIQLWLFEQMRAKPEQAEVSIPAAEGTPG